MSFTRRIPTLLGAAAMVGTVALIVVHIILARALGSTPSTPLRVTAVSAAVLEVVVLAILAWIFSLYVNPRAKNPCRSHGAIWFGLLTLVWVASTTVSASAMVCLNNAASSLPETIMGSARIPFLIGASVTLGVTSALQLIFLIAHFALHRMLRIGQSTDDLEQGCQRSPAQIKTIPYSQTSSPVTATRPRKGSVGSPTPPGSSSGRSTADTIGSFRSSFSHAVRPITSKTKLIRGGSKKSQRRAGSVDSCANGERMSMGEDAFDSWDTSSVDPRSREMVLQTTGTVLTLPSKLRSTGLPSKHLLETIPASPTTSRSPSPGSPLELAPPPRRPRRARSYSPVGLRARVSAGSLTQQMNVSESHIHPLFRSDSPTPPPLATPGTIVVASPNGGQMLASDSHSIRSLSISSRMRSGSMPQVSSPLSRQGSFEDFASVKSRAGGGISPRDDRRLAELELREEEEEEEEEDDKKSTRKSASMSSDSDEERQLTPTIPPIPDWVMTAGCRTSLQRYNSRVKPTDEP
ncbi:hypothetical protein MAPG_06435 [Magnaporthiopsis poae ATCC 64411]|uniref:Uncharacterized protein n=1 Tax=Magnaporthiopsis poae (strain ATCC 64411 / 73-15) TaxID=644358 RepID=A0A0C4E209_MAGP6|nr:hypothetical protein MAPG_06435 [Magnaporthiopsis poae ATCC 64411]